MNDQKHILLSYLAAILRIGIRDIIIAFVIIMMDVMLLLPAWFPPAEAIYFYLMAPPIIACNLWGLWLFFDKPGERQLKHVLFLGICGFIISVGSVILIQKFAYVYLNISTPLFFIGSIAVYMIMAFFVGRLSIGQFYRRLKQTEETESGSFLMAGILSGIGYVAANIFLSITGENMVYQVLIALYSLFAVVFVYFMMYLYYYWYVRKMCGTSL
ncbi:MAG: hypothetical protein ACE3JP_16295 [Ectobacillus sp.]